MDPKIIASRKALALNRIEKALYILVKKHNLNKTTRNAIRMNPTNGNPNALYRIETIAELVESLLKAAEASHPGTGIIPEIEKTIKNKKAVG